MISSQQISQVGASVAKLGGRRLAALAIIGIALTAAIVYASYYLARPAMQVIYSGLSAQDVARISTALAEAGVTFDVNEQRTAVLVPFGQTARARALLAQKGLPASAKAGYELFDQLGSIGLTSFMQEVTRVRALEGEIARTVQALDGVAAARVHLVMPEPSSFRRERREPSASVLVRVDERWQPGAAQVVRHLVAAAVPGMKVEHVSVASSDGRMLASGGDERSLGTHMLTEMERTMAAELEGRASRTLAPLLGPGNFQISVTTRLDVDRQQVNETVYDPKSKVERSVRVVKQSGSSEDGGAKPTVGVETNVPRENAGQTEGDKRRQREDRREELINYEVNSKSVQTVREGYRVQQVAIAAVLNRKQILASLGGNAAALDARIDEIKRLIVAATGLRDAQDRIEVSAIDFDGKDGQLAPVSGPGITDYLMMNIGTLINALALLGVVFVVVWFGLRPFTRTLSERDEAPTALGTDATAGAAGQLPGGGFATPELALPGGDFGSFANGFEAPQQGQIGQSASPFDEIRTRLTQIVDQNDAGVTRAMKSWMQEAPGQ